MTNANPSNESLSWGKLIAFSAPAFAFAGVLTPLNMYIAPYYATEMGLGLAAVGAIFMFARFFDMFTDPLLGVVSDKFPTRWGRRRHWMVLGMPVMLIAVFLLMFPTSVIGSQASILYLSVSIFLFYIGFTLLEISHISWGAELSPEYHERSRIQGTRQFFGLLGTACVLIIPFALEQSGYELSTGFKVSSMGWYILILLPITLFLAITSVGEPPDVPAPAIGWRKSVDLVLSNPYLGRILVADLLIAGPGAIRSAVFLFYIQTILQTPQYTAMIMMSYFVAGPLFVPMWIYISKRISKHKACAIGVLLHVIVSAGYLFPGQGDAILFAALFFASGVVYSGVPFLLRAITADIVDADKVESGQDRAGLFYSLITMTGKVGGALGIGIGYILLAYIGFDPQGGPDQPGIDGLRYIYAFTPVFTELLVFGILYKFPLDETVQRDLRERIAAREAAEVHLPELTDPLAAEQPEGLAPLPGTSGRD